MAVLVVFHSWKQTADWNKLLLQLMGPSRLPHTVPVQDASIVTSEPIGVLSLAIII